MDVIAFQNPVGVKEIKFEYNFKLHMELLCVSFFFTPLIFLHVFWIDFLFWNVVWLVVFVKTQTTREQRMGVGA